MGNKLSPEGASHICELKIHTTAETMEIGMKHCFSS